MAAASPPTTMKEAAAFLGHVGKDGASALPAQTNSCECDVPKWLNAKSHTHIGPKSNAPNMRNTPNMRNMPNCLMSP